ncbi:MAG: hypothetical protein ABF449_13020 [Ethanoligenens sp.]|uniref:hypothetical protein n=1 Tax=Ethanoligenens sp. TaxID=2099655 RepID=UPI0039EB568F
MVYFPSSISASIAEFSEALTIVLAIGTSANGKSIPKSAMVDESKDMQFYIWLLQMNPQIWAGRSSPAFACEMYHNGWFLSPAVSETDGQNDIGNAGRNIHATRLVLQ